MIRIGPAGWSYADWEGTVYPPRLPKASQLSFISRGFPTIEVNSSFYRIPAPTMVETWCRKVQDLPEFRFTLKAFQKWTHEGVVEEADVHAMRIALGILAGHGRLGMMLLQFPYSFKPGPEAEQRIGRIREAFPDHPLAVEVRHRSFEDEAFFEFLRARSMAFANIDQPSISGNLDPTCVRTAPQAYVRFHGRNAAKWFSHEETWERYDYLYSRQELEPWADRIRTLAKEGDVYVILNNHFRGQALQNARDLQQMLDLCETPSQSPLKLVP